MFVIRFTPGVIFFILAPIFGALIVFVCIVHANRDLQSRRLARAAGSKDKQLLSNIPQLYERWIVHDTSKHAEPKLSEPENDRVDSLHGDGWPVRPISYHPSTV